MVFENPQIMDGDSSCSNSSSLLSNDVLEVTITTTTSNKGKLMLVVDGYHFQFKNFNKDGSIKFWRCANRACQVLLHTSLKNEFIRYGGKLSIHSHLPNPSAVEVRNLREALRKRAQDENTPLQQIAEQEVRRALLTAEALAVLPGVNRLGMLFGFRVYRYRNTLFYLFYL